jgi:hypothetical protein
MCKPNYMSTAKAAAAADTAGRVRGWFLGRLPDGWFTGQPEVLVDREEIMIIGQLPGARASDQKFREETREARVGIAREAEALFGRKVSWGVVCQGRKVMFTTLSVPVMTRLRQAERRVLDTLVDSGVARSRSHALAWCVKLVRENQGEWIEELRQALGHVERAREAGPNVV